MDLMVGLVLDVCDRDMCPSHYVEILQEYVCTGYKFAQKVLGHIGEKQKHYYTTRATGVTRLAISFVMITNP